MAFSARHPLVSTHIVYDDETSQLLSERVGSSFAVLSPQTTTEDQTNTDEWVVFSPYQSSEGSVNGHFRGGSPYIGPDSRIDNRDQHGRDVRGNSNHEVIESFVQDTGTQTPLAFPSHNGSGSFLSAPLVTDALERVNAWRLDQSQFVLQEMQTVFKEEELEIESDKQDVEGRSDAPFINGDINGDAQKDIKEADKTSDDKISHDIPNYEETDSGSLWENIRRRVMEDFLGLNDQVMGIIFPPINSSSSSLQPTETQSSALQSSALHDIVTAEVLNEVSPGFSKEVNRRFERSLVHGPPDWDLKMVEQVLKTLRTKHRKGLAGVYNRRLVKALLAQNNNLNGPLYATAKGVFRDKSRSSYKASEMGATSHSWSKVFGGGSPMLGTSGISKSYMGHWNTESYSSSNYWESSSVSIASVH